MKIYSIKNDDTIGQWLTKLEKEELVIPTLQRPFVWSPSKVCSLIESLYLGYPIGFFVFAEEPDIALKTGGTSTARSFVVIDGHQRVMSLQAALLGKQTFNKKYQQGQIAIAFHPVKEKFEVFKKTKKEYKDPKSGWIADISELFKDDFESFPFVKQYCETVPDAIDNVVAKRLDQLLQIRNHHQGVFVVNSGTPLQTISDLFYRLNRMGVKLTAADFIMAALCSNVDEEGDLLRKAIDHFCYLVHPLSNKEHLLEDEDSKFATSEYYEKMSWLKGWKGKRIFYPDYTNVLWIISAIGLGIGGSKGIKELEDRLVGASDSEVSDSFFKLKNGFLKFVDETNFNRFVMILSNLGFTEMVAPRALTCSYILYLTLRTLGEITDKIESLVGRWFVMSILTNRTTAGAPDATLRKDIAGILNEDVGRVKEYVDQEISKTFSENFWENLSSDVEKKMMTGKDNFVKVYLASHINAGDKGFLSKKLTVQTLLEGKKNNHHLFPVNYLVKELEKMKITEKAQVNRIVNKFANIVVTQEEHNKKISDTPPSTYLREILEKEKTSFAEICGTELKNNLTSHCIPMETDLLENYDMFIEKRAALMVEKVRNYFESL